MSAAAIFGCRRRTVCFRPFYAGHRKCKSTTVTRSILGSGTNENSSGLLRQYFPNDIDLSAFSHKLSTKSQRS